MKRGKPQPTRALWSKAIQDLLADGRWHDRAEVIAVGARAVPPGVAWRRAEQHRLDNQTRRVGELRPRQGDEHSAVEAGSRRVASQVLYALVKHGKVLREDDRYCLARPADQAREASG